MDWDNQFMSSFSISSMHRILRIAVLLERSRVEMSVSICVLSNLSLSMGGGGCINSTPQYLVWCQDSWSHIHLKKDRNLWLIHHGFSGELGGFKGAPTVAWESGTIGIDLSLLGGIRVLDHRACSWRRCGYAWFKPCKLSDGLVQRWGSRKNERLVVWSNILYICDMYINLYIYMNTYINQIKGVSHVLMSELWG